jgi:hypothetical protein
VRGSGPRGSARSDCKLLRPRATCQTHLLANGGNVVRGHHFGRRAAMMKKALAGQKRGAAVRSRGTWKLVSARCCVSGTNWRARRCGRSSLGRRSLRCWQRHSLYCCSCRQPCQSMAPPPPASREAARPGTPQNFLGWLRPFAPTPRRQSRAAFLPSLPRPRPTELTSTPIETKPEELAPASVQSDQTQTPTEPAPAPDEPSEGPLND